MPHIFPWEILPVRPVIVQAPIVQVPIVRVPVVQNRIEHHVRAPPPVVRKTTVEHVYEPQPRQVVEREVHHYHHGSDVRHSSKHEHHEYHDESDRGGKKSRRKTIKHLSDLSEESGYSDDSRGASRKPKGEEKRRDDEKREYSGKGKGKDKRANYDEDAYYSDDNDYSTHHSSQKHEKKQSSSHSRRDTRKDRSSKNERHGKSRSRSRTRSRSRSRDTKISAKRSSRRESTRRESTHRDEHRRSGYTHTETYEIHEAHSYTIQEDDDGDKYHGSDSDRSAHKLPSTSRKQIKDAPNRSSRTTSKPPKPEEPGPFEPYKVFGLKKTADQTDIKASYQTLIVKYHPDKQVNKSKDEQKRAEERSADLNRAKDILMDPKRRAVYDRTGETELYKIDEQVEKDSKNSMALVRPGAFDEDEKQGRGSTKKVSKSVKGFFGK